MAHAPQPSLVRMSAFNVFFGFNTCIISIKEIKSIACAVNRSIAAADLFCCVVLKLAAGMHVYALLEVKIMRVIQARSS